jgi:hypothetical protein
MRHRFIIAVALIVGISFAESRWHYGPWSNNVDASSGTLTQGNVSPTAIDDAYRLHASGVIVTGEGIVDRTLADDTSGERHQRFIVRLPSGLTILVAHNIDMAPPIRGITAGSAVRIHGEYEWSDKGGTVHWTHRDHRGNHEAGWIEFNGKTYD